MLTVEKVDTIVKWYVQQPGAMFGGGYPAPYSAVEFKARDNPTIMAVSPSGWSPTTGSCPLNLRVPACLCRGIMEKRS